jgi:hypothetical protein
VFARKRFICISLKETRLNKDVSPLRTAQLETCLKHMSPLWCLIGVACLLSRISFEDNLIGDAVYSKHLICFRTFEMRFVDIHLYLRAPTTLSTSALSCSNNYTLATHTTWLCIVGLPHTPLSFALPASHTAADCFASHSWPTNSVTLSLLEKPLLLQADRLCALQRQAGAADACVLPHHRRNYDLHDSARRATSTPRLCFEPPVHCWSPCTTISSCAVARYLSRSLIVIVQCIDASSCVHSRRLSAHSLLEDRTYISGPIFICTGYFAHRYK